MRGLMDRPFFSSCIHWLDVSALNSAANPSLSAQVLHPLPCHAMAMPAVCPHLFPDHPHHARAPWQIASMAEAVGANVAQLRRRACVLSGRADFNPAASGQLAHVLYSQMGLPEPTATGG